MFGILNEKRGLTRTFNLSHTAYTFQKHRYPIESVCKSQKDALGEKLILLLKKEMSNLTLYPPKFERILVFGRLEK